MNRMLVWYLYIFFFKQKTAYEMRISDWSSDVCSSDLPAHRSAGRGGYRAVLRPAAAPRGETSCGAVASRGDPDRGTAGPARADAVVRPRDLGNRPHQV